MDDDDDDDDDDVDDVDDVDDDIIHLHLSQFTPDVFKLLDIDQLYVISNELH